MEGSDISWIFNILKVSVFNMLLMDEKLRLNESDVGLKLRHLWLLYVAFDYNLECLTVFILLRIFLFVSVPQNVVEHLITLHIVHKVLNIWMENSG
jgi:hypothetical protein